VQEQASVVPLEGPLKLEWLNRGCGEGRNSRWDEDGRGAHGEGAGKESHTRERLNSRGITERTDSRDKRDSRDCKDSRESRDRLVLFGQALAKVKGQALQQALGAVPPSIASLMTAVATAAAVPVTALPAPAAGGQLEAAEGGPVSNSGGTAVAAAADTAVSGGALAEVKRQLEAAKGNAEELVLLEQQQQQEQEGGGVGRRKGDVACHLLQQLLSIKQKLEGAEQQLHQAEAEGQQVGGFQSWCAACVGSVWAKKKYANMYPDMRLYDEISTLIAACC
jgi:hypothetical protein